VITSFAGFLNRIVQLLDGEDVAGTVLDSDTLRTIARMGELRVYRDVESRFNQKAFSALTSLNNAVSIPADLSKVTKIWTDGKPLEAVTEEFLRNENDYQRSGDCKYFATAGNQLIFSPPLTDGTAINGRYQYRMEPLETAWPNAFFTAYEDLFVYAALVEGEPFYGALPEKLALWTQRYLDIKNSIEYDERNIAYNASSIRVRPSVRVLR